VFFSEQGVVYIHAALASTTYGSLNVFFSISKFFKSLSSELATTWVIQRLSVIAIVCGFDDADFLSQS